jgi:hypothetical protein
LSEVRFQSTADLLDSWRDDVLSGKPATFYPVATDELARIEIGPGLVTLVGGAPGKERQTAFIGDKTKAESPNSIGPARLDVNHGFSGDSAVF